MQESLGASNDVVKMALAGKSPEERAKELIDGTKLDDVAFRKQLYEGGTAAVNASNDPLIVLMRQVEPAGPALCISVMKMRCSRCCAQRRQTSARRCSPRTG